MSGPCAQQRDSHDHWSGVAGAGGDCHPLPIEADQPEPQAGLQCPALAPFRRANCDEPCGTLSVGSQGTAQAGSAPSAYLLAMQALQVDEEWLVVPLAPGDFGESLVCLAQQLLLWQLGSTEGQR